MGKAGEKEKTTTVAKMVSEAWKSLPSDQRKYWDEMAQQDKERYEMEKSVYNGPWKVPVEKVLKDPSAPKRPMSAFLSYSNSKRAALKRKHPHMTNADVSRTLAAMWRQAKPDLKQKYIDTEFKLRQDYKVAIAEWRAKAEERERLQHEQDFEAKKRQQQQSQDDNGILNIEGMFQSPLLSRMQQFGGTWGTLHSLTQSDVSKDLVRTSFHDETSRGNEESPSSSDNNNAFSSIALGSAAISSSSTNFDEAQHQIFTRVLQEGPGSSSLLGHLAPFSTTPAENSYTMPATCLFSRQQQQQQMAAANLAAANAGLFVSLPSGVMTNDNLLNAYNNLQEKQAALASQYQQHSQPQESTKHSKNDKTASVDQYRNLFDDKSNPHFFLQEQQATNFWR